MRFLRPASCSRPTIRRRSGHAQPCAISSVKTGLVEIPADRIVFATDYPQEIRKREIVRDFVRDIRALGKDGETILSGNVGKLLKKP